MEILFISNIGPAGYQLPDVLVSLHSGELERRFNGALTTDVIRLRIYISGTTYRSIIVKQDETEASNVGR